ncbi:MAG: RAMP superfamily CRISPR-associated protein [Pseudomonadota bacterium]
MAHRNTRKKHQHRAGGGQKSPQQRASQGSRVSAASPGPSASARSDAFPTGAAAGLLIDLHGFWHPGTGRGDGAGADAVVHRDGAGLPFLPGRTVKGLLRQAVRLGVEAGIDGLSKDVEELLFGSELPGFGSPDHRVRCLEEERFATQAGVLLVGSARLGAGIAEATKWQAYAKSEEGAQMVQHLLGAISSTALDEHGVAEDHSLRTIEVVVPVTLYAPLQARSLKPGAPPPNIPWEAVDTAVRLFLRAVGSHRNRGLGRCSAAIVSEAP